MSGIIIVHSEEGEIIAEHSFESRSGYMSLLAHLLETFRSHRIEITFESGL
jgi:hypothetical protein